MQDTSFDEYFQKWLSGIPSELSFWERFCKNKGGEYADHFSFITSESPKFQLEKYLPDNKWPVNVLDVGAGPISRVGIQSEKGPINIVSCDPLAYQYTQILQSFQIKPYVVTEFAFSEKLQDIYPLNTFDLVHMSNALDHSFFPIVAIQQMLNVCTDKGVIILSHHENEAEWEKYKGLHQWNITEKNGDLIIWKEDTILNVTDIFKDVAIIIVERIHNHRDSILATLQKKSSAEIEIVKRINDVYDSIMLKMVIEMNNKLNNEMINYALICNKMKKLLNKLKWKK